MIEIGLLCCALSKHLTHEFNNEYNEQHESLGLYVEKHYEPHSISMQGFYFKDSFSEPSKNITANYKYKAHEYVGVGAGAGYLKTSYYEGPIILPILEIGKDIKLQISAFPKAFGSEALIMGQIKLKLK